MRCPSCDREYSEGTKVCAVDGTALLEADDPTLVDVIVKMDSGAFGDPFIGTVLDGRYHAVQRLGVGGMGRVYRARQLNVGRDVAVKVLNAPASADPGLVKRFANEAHIISQLRHPNTLKLIDFGQTSDGLIYTVTEFLAGDPLDRVLEDGPIDPNLALRIMREVCESLEEAHGRGVIHRDLKPGNIFLEVVGPQERVKVLDFGIAKLSEQPDLTPAGNVFGSPAYMSPEQARGDEIDGRSDLYSLGVLAYQCLAGRTPFTDAKPLAVMLKHINEPPPPIEGVPSRGSVGELVAVIMRLLEKDPDKRPASAAALRDDLERLEQRWTAAGMTDDSLPAVRPKGRKRNGGDEDLTENIRRPMERSRLSPAAVALVAALVTATALLTVWALNPPESEEETTRAAEGSTQVSASGAPAATPDPAPTKPNPDSERPNPRAPAEPVATHPAVSATTGGEPRAGSAEARAGDPRPSGSQAPTANGRAHGLGDVDPARSDRAAALSDRDGRSRSKRRTPHPPKVRKHPKGEVKSTEPAASAEPSGWLPVELDGKGNKEGN